MDAINSVFEKVAEHRPHMVLFPEFAIPGVQGVECVAAALSSGDVESPTIVIGGVSGLTKMAFDELCALPDVTLIDLVNAPPRVQNTQWINASVTFVKDDEGTVRLWLQPKLSPSWPEAHCHHQTMFQGGLVRIFRARFDNDVPCRFLSFACFDWVGQENGVQITGSSQRSVQFWSVSMANKSSIVSDLHGWRTPSVSGEELQAPGKSGPQ